MGRRTCSFLITTKLLLHKMILDAKYQNLLGKVKDGNRISKEDALALYELPLEELGALAQLRRIQAQAHKYGGLGNQVVTYIVDRNINYTNVCDVYCKFCAFYRTETSPEAYVLSKEVLDSKIRETLDAGGTQILMQGGHHPALKIDWYLDLLSHIRSKFPSINIHGFSPSEFVHFKKVFNLPLRRILELFKEAGLGSIPGGGGEILVDQVRRQISPLKASTSEWLEVMDIAHSIGLNSTATMMFGHVESIHDRVEHLDRVRSQQDLSRGFTAFIAWTFQDSNTRLKADPVGATEYLRTQALSRIYLDNFANIQSSWVTQGLEIGQIALLYGANDLGSIMLEENVVSKAGTTYQMSVQDMRRLICDMGFIPKQRDNWYRLLPTDQKNRVSTSLAN